MTENARAQRPQRRRSILAETFPDEAILYNAEAGTLHVLNATATAVWTMCDGEHDQAAMVESLHGRFAVGPEHRVEQDVDRALDELHSLGLLNLA